MPIKVLIADDHTILREGLKMILESSGNIQVIAEFENGRNALKGIRENAPDVAVLDITMPGLNGIDVATRVKEEKLDTRIIILTMHDTDEYIHTALKAGAMGYILKESAGKEIIDAVKTVSIGNYYFSSKIGSSVIQSLTSNKTIPTNTPLETLSSREREIMQLVIEGKSSAQIAKVIFLSPKTVETYRSRLMKKLGVKNHTELVRFAVEHGLTPGS